MPGAVRRSSARSGGRNTAETPSGAPIVNRRLDVPGLNGSAVEMTLRTRARISAIGAARSVARAVGTTPLGVLTNSGSLSSRRSRPSPWLTAEAVRFSRSAARPTWRSSSTVSNSTRRLRSARERSISFSISLKSYHWRHRLPTVIPSAAGGWPRLETGPRHQQNCTDCHKENARPVRSEPQESHAAPWRLQSVANRPGGIRATKRSPPNSSACHVQESAENEQRAKPHQEHSRLSIHRCDVQQGFKHGDGGWFRLTGYPRLRYSRRSKDDVNRGLRAARAAASFLEQARGQSRAPLLPPPQI